jgi:lysophospholipase L1-like esterase
MPASRLEALAGTASRSAAAAPWVASWAASSVAGSAVPGSGCPAGGLTDSTVRNVVFLSVGGSSVRVRLTNAFGTRPMRIGRASVAVQASGASPVAGTVRALTFGGQRAVTIPVGGRLRSDPVALSPPALSTLLVSAYVPGPSGPISNHPFTAQGNFLAAGDQVEATTAGGFQDTPCWMLIDAVEVQPPSRVVGSVVALGDSITDTASTTGDANRRWPDFLARRMDALAAGPVLAVANAGLGGNRVLASRPGEPFYGVPAIARLDRDVLTTAGVREVILLEGINDIGLGATADQLIAGYRRIIARTQARGLRIFGGTMTPFKGSDIWSEQRQQTWDAVNLWIRSSGAFDGVVDFARATAAPGDPLTLNPAHDSGDHLHPNDAGTKALADAVDLPLLIAEPPPRPGWVGGVRAIGNTTEIGHLGGIS